MPTLGGNTRADPPLPLLEDLWTRFDAVFDSLTDTGWARKHGKDWVVGDLPWHLYYFDRDLVLAALSRGQSVSSDVLADVPQTIGQLNAWNAREFAARPSDETPQRSVARWREVRARLRDALVKLESGGLDDPVFVPLMGAGWMPARAALAANIGHHWNHFTQRRLYLKRSGPLESPVVRHAGLSFYMSFFQVIARANSVARPFTFTLDFTGPGGGPFTLRLADGCCTLSEEDARTADLVMTQSPETFVKTFAHMHNPMLAMLTGQVKVRGLRSVGGRSPSSHDTHRAAAHAERPGPGDGSDSGPGFVRCRAIPRRSDRQLSQLLRSTRHDGAARVDASARGGIGGALSATGPCPTLAGAAITWALRYRVARWLSRARLRGGRSPLGEARTQPGQS